MREKLIELISYFGDCLTTEQREIVPGTMVVEIADHLIDNGAAVLPWKIGDEFWTEWVGIRKVRCSMLTQKADGTWKGRFTVENSGGCGIDVAFDKAGRRLFRTKEEAEAYFARPEEDWP